MDLGFRVKGYSPPQVDRMWGIWGSYDNVTKHQLKGDYKVYGSGFGILGCRVWMRNVGFSVRDLGLSVRDFED